eukprot:TRINITY_DN37433_c0_g1_i1.p4 TRINITY_DN37433_c0_g1~~TRINITY_DN37433_c0_g1_i1.p4  ORF type:complete len:133 (-),score=37.79 TRINITY_DN37433_c0_g1_i1:233-631(-)
MAEAAKDLSNAAPNAVVVLDDGGNGDKDARGDGNTPSALLEDSTPMWNATATSALPASQVQGVLEKICSDGVHIDDQAARVVSAMADRFVDSVVDAAAKIARHRGGQSVEASDVQLALELDWGVALPPARPS